MVFPIPRDLRGDADRTQIIRTHLRHFPAHGDTGPVLIDDKVVSQRASLGGTDKRSLSVGMAGALPLTSCASQCHPGLVRDAESNDLVLSLCGRQIVSGGEAPASWWESRLNRPSGRGFVEACFLEPRRGA